MAGRPAGEVVTSPTRVRALAFNAVGDGLDRDGRGFWLPLNARERVADAVVEAVAPEIRAGEHSAVQDVLDDLDRLIRDLRRRGVEPERLRGLDEATGRVKRVMQ